MILSWARKLLNIALAGGATVATLGGMAKAALRFVLCNGRGLQGMEPLFRKAFGDFCQLFLL